LNADESICPLLVKGYVMRLEQILATLIIALLAGTLSSYFVIVGRSQSPQPVAIVAALEQMVTSGKIRCGYIIEEPSFTKAANGAFSGIWYQISESLAERAKLSIVWTAPTTAASLVADLKAKKFDALCTGFTPSLALAKELSFSTPAYYNNNQPIGFVSLASAHDVRDFLSIGMAELPTQAPTKGSKWRIKPQPDSHAAQNTL